MDVLADGSDDGIDATAVLLKAFVGLDDGVLVGSGVAVSVGVTVDVGAMVASLGVGWSTGTRAVDDGVSVVPVMVYSRQLCLPENS